MEILSKFEPHPEDYQTEPAVRRLVSFVQASSTRHRCSIQIIGVFQRDAFRCIDKSAEGTAPSQYRARRTAIMKFMVSHCGLAPAQQPVSTDRFGFIDEWRTASVNLDAGNRADGKRTGKLFHGRTAEHTLRSS